MYKPEITELQLGSFKSACAFSNNLFIKEEIAPILKFSLQLNPEHSDFIVSRLAFTDGYITAIQLVLQLHDIMVREKWILLD